ncbi:MAG TPA: serine/threonine-protein kinase [Candidatus Dormibacteraeota bacterium]
MSIGQGTKLGQYEVQDFIGQGAMGLVYRAYHAQLERTGAIKVMQAITPDQDTVARFRHEAQAIAKLRHPNIVDVYDFGEFQGTPYMIVEYIPGGSLATRMEHGPLDRATALKYLRGIAAGLDYAHNHGIVHRDVKPANVLMTNEDTPVLADFGLAKLLQGSSLKSMTGVTTGTPAYMAPEQVTGHQVGPAADRYSLATIAYEMLTGYIPFDGEALMELLYAQVHRLPPPASSRSADLSPEVDAVLLKGLAKDPKARWESATAFVEALDAALAAPPARVLAETMVMASPVTSTRRLATTVAPPPEFDRFVDAETTVAYPSPPPPAPPPKRSRRRLAIGLAALLVLLLLLGVCAVASQATTLAVDPQRTVPGGRVTVTATHVPANQVGEIQLLSSPYTYTFRSNSGGEVSQEIVVPADIELGNHIVRICWDRSCHKQTPLRVVSGVAEAEPTPIANASPTVSSSPSAGPTPKPGSTPSPKPTASATSTPPASSTPRSSPTPTRSPSPSPLPTPTPSPYVTVSAISATLTTTVTFHYFYGGATAVSVCQDGTCYPYALNPLSVAPGASTTVSFKTPVGIKPTSSLLHIGQARVVTGCCGATGYVTVGA